MLSILVHYSMSYQIDNAAVTTIATDCVKGFRKVSVHVGTKYEAGFMGASSLHVWVPEEVTDINEIKHEALCLAKALAAEIASSDLLPSKPN